VARARGNLPHDFPDRAIRDALLNGQTLRALLRDVAPDLADRLDYSRVESVPPTYLLDDWRKRDNDILLRLPFRDPADGREILICILVEHQSTTDPAMPLRLLVYAVLFWEREWKQWEDGHERGAPLRLTPVIPVVLHTGAEPWDSNRTLADLFEVPDQVRPFLPQWVMPLWDLPAHPTQDLLDSREAFWQALAVARASQAPTEEFLAVVRQIFDRLAPLGHQQNVYWHELLRMVLGWSLYRRPRREHPTLIQAARDAHADNQLQQEIQQMSAQLEKTWGEELEEQYAARLAKQVAEQVAEQVAKREVQTSRDNLRLILRHRFSTLAPEVLQRIENANLEQLKQALPQVLTIQSPEELVL
jgi:hypothetical protein